MENGISCKKVFSRVGLCYFTLALVATLLQAVLSVVFMDQLSAGGWWPFVISYVPLYGIALPLFLLMMKKLIPDGGGAFGTARLTAGGWVRLFFLSLGITYIGNIFSTVFTQLLGALKQGEVVNPLQSVTQASGLLPTFVFVCLVAPVAEELLFRKLLYDKIGQFGTRVYIPLSAFIFALFHMNFSQILYAFLLGMLFAYIYAGTGKLLYTILLHAAINTVGSVLMPLLVSDPENTTMTAVAGFLVIVLIVVGIVIAVRRRWRFSPETAAPRPAEALPEADGDGPEPAGKPAAPSFGRALCTPGMIAYIALCALMILLVTLA